MPSIRIAVLSDLHFFLKEEGNSSAVSHLPVDDGGSIWSQKRGPNKNPIEDLIHLVETEELTVDAVICPGDLTTRANPIALQSAWKHLNDLARALKATDLFAATGNHDVDSRSQKNQIDKNPIRNLSVTGAPVESLKMLEPLYPVVRLDGSRALSEQREIQSKYFGESFLLADQDPRYRVLIFNSCAEHGHDPHEYERGTTPQSALRWIDRDIEALTEQKINVLVTHHPLIPQSVVDGESYSFLRGGDALIRALEKGGDAWLIINGHKHNGEVKNAPGSSNALMTLFSCASFAATSETVQPGCENQFYVIDILLADDGDLSGTIQVWNWNAGHQWRKAPPQKDSGIFYGCGFGSKLNPNQIAKEISRLFEDGSNQWNDICAGFDEIGRVMPNALRSAVSLLEKKYGLIIEKDADGFYSRVARKA